MKVYFVRHGETEFNKLGLEQNREGKLTDLGRDQAGFVAKRFASTPIDLIISSPYPRAKETAEIINQVVKKDIIFSDLLIEYVMPSLVVGKPISDIKTIDMYRLLAKNWLTNAKHSDEETYKDLVERAKKALNFIREQKKENILVVTHGMFVRVLAMYILLGEHLDAKHFEHMIYALQTKNTGITFAEYRERIIDSPQLPGWKLIAWNDHAHLGEIR